MRPLLIKTLPTRRPNPNRELPLLPKPAIVGENTRQIPRLFLLRRSQIHQQLLMEEDPAGGWVDRPDPKHCSVRYPGGPASVQADPVQKLDPGKILWTCGGRLHLHQV